MDPSDVGLRTINCILQSIRTGHILLRRPDPPRACEPCDSEVTDRQNPPVMTSVPAAIVAESRIQIIECLQGRFQGFRSFKIKIKIKTKVRFRFRRGLSGAFCKRGSRVSAVGMAAYLGFRAPPGETSLPRNIHCDLGT